MTTRWADGFEDVASGVANFQPEYTATAGSGLNVGTGRRASTQALSTTNGTLQRSIGGTESTMFQSAAFNLTAGFGTGRVMKFMEGSIVHVSLAFDTAGKITVYRGDGVTLLGTSAAVVATPGSWVWFQVKVVIHDTTGSVEVRDASGNVIIALTSQDTRNAGTGYCDAVLIGGPSSTAALIDDWHAWDTTGSVCNTWTNDTRIDSILATGAGASTQFTPSTGSNWDAVNEPTWNSTDYVDSATAGHQDLYAFGDLAHTPVNIFGVIRTAVAQKDDAGARSLKLLTRRGGTTYAGSAQTLTMGSYMRLTDVQETDPSTSAAWTKTNLNAAEFGFENV